MATEFILINPNNNQIVPMEEAEQMRHDYIVEDENGELTNMNGTKRWAFCHKIRKTPFKDINGIEIWEDDIIRINGRRATIKFTKGKFYFSYCYDLEGNEADLFCEENLFRLYANDVKKSDYLYSVYRETPYSYGFNLNFYEDICISLKQSEEAKKNNFEEYKNEMPFNVDKEALENYCNSEIKRLKKLKKSFKELQEV